MTGFDGSFVEVRGSISAMSDTLVERVDRVDDRLQARMDAESQAQQQRFDTLQRENAQILAELSALRAETNSRLDALTSAIQDIGYVPVPIPVPVPKETMPGANDAGLELSENDTFPNVDAIDSVGALVGVVGMLWDHGFPAAIAGASTSASVIMQKALDGNYTYTLEPTFDGVSSNFDCPDCEALPVRGFKTQQSIDASLLNDKNWDTLVSYSASKTDAVPSPLLVVYDASVSSLNVFEMIDGTRLELENEDGRSVLSYNNGVSSVFYLQKNKKASASAKGAETVALAGNKNPVSWDRKTNSIVRGVTLDPKRVADCNVLLQKTLKDKKMRTVALTPVSQSITLCKSELIVTDRMTVDKKATSFHYSVFVVR